MTTDALAALANTQEAETALDTLLDAEDEATEATVQDAPAQETQGTQEQSSQEGDETPADPPADAATPDPAEPDTGDADTTDESETRAATLPPPALWNAEQKAAWDGLSPDVQEIILTREKTVQGEITRRQQENARLQLELRDVKAQPDTELSQLLEMGRERFGARYQGLTDTDLMEAVNGGRITFEQAQQIKTERDAEATALRQLETARETREAGELQELAERRTLELQRDMPELTTSQEAQQSVLQYLTAAGYSADEVKWASSRDLITAYKAAQFDALQSAKAKAKPAATKTGKALSAKPVQSGNIKAQRRADLLAKGTPEALEALLDMELDDD